MLPIKNNVKIKILSLQRSTIVSGRDDEALPRNGRAFFMSDSLNRKYVSTLYWRAAP